QLEDIAGFRCDRDLVAVQFIDAFVDSVFSSGLESSALQACNNVIGREPLSGINAIGRGVDLSRVLEDLTAQLAIDDARVIVVVIEDDCRRSDEKEEEERKKNLEQRRPKEVRKLFLLRRLCLPRLTFSHVRQYSITA